MQQHIDPNFEFFESQLPRLLEEGYRGKFVLIKDSSIKGCYSTMEEALTDAYVQFGDSEFLIQEVTDEKRVNYISSLFGGE